MDESGPGGYCVYFDTILALVGAAMKLKNTVIGIFLLLFLVLLVSFNATKPRVVVLHSSGKDLPWAVDIDAAMDKALANNRIPLSVQWHYMGLENKPRPEQRNVAIADANRLIRQIDPDILIAIDDEANALVAKQFAGKKRPKIVFVSIDQPPETYGYKNASNVSGIAEKLPLKAIHEAIGLARPEQPARIAAVSINNETGRAEMIQALNFDWKPHALTQTLKARHFEEWQSFVLSLAEDTDILLVFNSDGLPRSASDLQTVSAKEITLWTEANSAPLPVGVNSSFIQNGGGLMFSTSASEYSQRAIQMTLNWLSASENAAPPPIITSAHFHVGVRAQSLKARNIVLPDIYIETARIGNNYVP
jgi:hypothetical protein